MKSAALNIYKVLEKPLGESGASALMAYIDDSSEAKIIKQVELRMEHLATKKDLNDVRLEVRDLKVGLKSDISALRIEVKDDMAALKGELKEDIAGLKTGISEVRADMIKWMFIFITTQTALIITIVKLL